MPYQSCNSVVAALRTHRCRHNGVLILAVIEVDVRVEFSGRRQQQRGVDQVAQSAGRVGVLRTDEIVQVPGVPWA